MQNANRLPSVQELVQWIVQLNDRCKGLDSLLAQQKQINQQVKSDMNILLKNQNELNARLLKLEQSGSPAAAPVGAAVVVDVPEGAEPADLAEGETYVEQPV